MSDSSHKGTIRRFGDRILYRASAEAEEVPARIVWARPLTSEGQEISILLEEKKEELVFLSSVEELDEESRRIALEELAQNSIMPEIKRVESANANFGLRFWKVDTDRGTVQFLMHSPETSVLEPSPGRMILRDTMENVYDIPDVGTMDEASQVKIDAMT